MRKLAALCAVAVLAACSQKADEAAPADTATTAEAVAPAPTPASMAVDGKPDAGTYEVTGPDGSKSNLTINADGTLSSEAGGKTVKGTWTKNGSANYCVTMDGATAATCYTDTMDGTTWKMTNDADPKDVSTVVRTS